MSLTTLLISAFAMGILGSGHCVSMCGGIASLAGYVTAGTSTVSKSWRIFCFNFGRLTSYTLIALLLSTLIHSFEDLIGMHFIGKSFEILAGILLCSIGLYLAGWWKGIRIIERQGHRVWQLLMPLAKRFLPIKNPSHAFIVGIFWGWLPCGLLYSALSLSLLATQPWQSTLTMVAFGLGTLPSMLLAGHLSAQLKEWTQNPLVRTSLGIIFITFGAWSTFSTFTYAI